MFREKAATLAAATTNEAARKSDEMAEWVQRDYGKGVIDRAGAHLIPWWRDRDVATDESIAQAFAIVENWRTSHAFPLNTFQIGLRNRARRVEDNPLVAQRLKRFPSVMNKLVREPKMKLSQMHDLGGCRAILSDVAAVDRLYDLYRGGGRLVFDDEGATKFYDYIRNPKDDGYRGIHVVGRYAARYVHREPWNGLRIEVQIRSRLQHAFATTVETVTTFTREPLKFGAGPAEWRRFFSLMGSALAIEEGTPPVKGTPHYEDELIRELRDATSTLRVRQRLRGWANALQALPRRNVKKFKWLLLVLNLNANTIKVTGYPERQKASEAIAAIEKQKRPELDAVLVSVDSARDLRSAYPNYYADARQFIAALTKVLDA